MSRTTRAINPQEKAMHLPKYFAKHGGHFGQSPTECKKNGFGRGNWGRIDGQDEVDQLDSSSGEQFHFLHTRRHSNSNPNPLDLR